MSAQSVMDTVITTTDSVQPSSKIRFLADSATENADRAVVSPKDSAANEKPKRHSPTKAALFSAVLPGLGQGYNKKYWKIPIVYVGFGGLGYAIYYTATEFKGYRNAYRLQVDEDPTTYGSYKGADDAATLKSYRDYYKRYLDISAICTAVWYTLNIVDAAVDAHLFEWNMRDDLNVSWNPVLLSPGGNYRSASLGLQVRFTL